MQGWRAAWAWGVVLVLAMRLGLGLVMGATWLALKPYLPATLVADPRVYDGLPTYPTSPADAVLGVWLRWDAVHLLNLARLGRKELHLQVTGLSSIVEGVAGVLKRETANRAVEWKIQSLPFVECDPALMEVVFTNLLSNAVKYSRPREQAVIEVGSVEENGHPVIFVRDNGVGFSMKYADKLFGVFQRLHRAEDFEGTGIGLATVQRILHKHGGRIWAEAELDKGACFYFTIGTSPQ